MLDINIREVDFMILEILEKWDEDAKEIVRNFQTKKWIDLMQ